MYLNALHDEPIIRRGGPKGRYHPGAGQEIPDLAARRAERVAVILNPGVVMRPLGIDVYFHDLPEIPKGLKGFVYSGERYGWVHLKDFPVYVIGGGLIRVVKDKLKYTQSLRGDLESGIAESIDHRSDCFHLLLH